jgi:DDE superfamily endonuclease
MQRAGVPEAVWTARSKPEIALQELQRLLQAGVSFGAVVTDAGYGISAPFRQALSALGLRVRPAGRGRSARCSLRSTTSDRRRLVNSIDEFQVPLLVVRNAGSFRKLFKDCLPLALPNGVQSGDDWCCASDNRRHMLLLCERIAFSNVIAGTFHGLEDVVGDHIAPITNSCRPETIP